MSNDNAQNDPDHRPAVGAQVQRGVRPRAWLCELAQEDGTTRTQFVEQDPDGLRWNDAGEPSPYRTTPLYEAPRWVPVTEALPPEHVTCAVRMQGDYIATAWAAYWHGARTDFARWVFPHDSDEDCTDKITHWLALPPVVDLGA